MILIKHSRDFFLLGHNFVYVSADFSFVNAALKSDVSFDAQCILSLILNLNPEPNPYLHINPKPTLHIFILIPNLILILTLTLI